MAWRDKNIEDLAERYAAYLKSLPSETLEYLASEPALIMEPAPSPDINTKKVTDRLYAASPFDLGTPEDNGYRDGIDKALEEAQEIADAI